MMSTPIEVMATHLQRWREACYAELPVLEALQKGVLAGHPPALELIEEALLKLQHPIPATWSASDIAILHERAELQELRSDVSDLLTHIRQILEDIQHHSEKRRTKVTGELNRIQQSLVGRTAYQNRRREGSS
jgi:hypothetical protein